MDGILRIQLDLYNSIKKGLANFKKSPKDRVTKEYIEARLENLERDWLLFRSNNIKLFEISDSDQLASSSYVTKEVYEITEENYLMYKSHMKSLLKSFVIPDEDLPSRKDSNLPGSFVRLPKINIPLFSGNYAEWTSFRDLFVSLIHRNESLDNVQRMHYLKTHLTGEAEQLIRHTPITSTNYDQCWSLLENRYENKKYLTNCIFKRLFGQKRMNFESASGLKELLDTTIDCLNALKNINVDVSTWDIIIIHIVTYKLDQETRKQWELHISNAVSSTELPTLAQFKTFIETRFRALEFIDMKQPSYQHSSRPIIKSKSLLVTKDSSMRCEYCSEVHKLCFCKSFAKLSTETRRDFVAKNKICFNCLGSNHNIYNCKKPTVCTVCRKRHHTLLHLNQDFEAKGHNTTDKPATSSSSASTRDNPIASCVATGHVPKPLHVLLPTAVIKAESSSGSYQFVRALIDQGSQACFITEATVQYLNLKKTPVHGVVSGLGSNRSTIAKHIVHLPIQSRIHPEFKLELKAYVLSKITSYLPERNISLGSFDWISINGLQLADPEFTAPNKIDVLLGADVYSCIMKEGMVKSPTETMIAQNTTLGWILSGAVNPVNNKGASLRHINVMHAEFEDESLRKFWEMEEINSTRKILTPEEERCERIYHTTTKRRKDGRYVVRLPFRNEDPSCKFGRSRAIAENRFKTLERKLEKNKDLKAKYTEVINEYLRLGHMRPVKEDDSRKEEAVYLPHHAVVREDKSTTKIRVVFNASQKNNKGVSLNDTLMVGPTLQADLRHTVLRWRTYPIALTADIIKMYRQVRIDEEHAIYQRILWRDCSNKAIKDYELMTVTFGTASAPYLAVRSLHQITYDEGDNYQLVAEKVLNSFYMDDMMTGCYSVEEGVNMYQQVKELLGKGGFSMQKWMSNNQELLERIRKIEKTSESMNQREHLHKNEISRSEEQLNKRYEDIQDGNLNGIDREAAKEIGKDKETQDKLDNTIKILGLTWNRSEDLFQYSVNLPPLVLPVTKRTIISDIARLFDPLGWLAPSVILAKIFIQKLWLAAVGWDEELGIALVREWKTYREELYMLTTIRIPRWLRTKTCNDLELHGFCDASKAAYAAVVYLRVVDVTGKIHLSLLVAKTRVAPIKQISIPRLELCGAVLLSKLLAETGDILKIPQDKIIAWTDSTVVLSWLNSHPSRWKTFVANRTSEILTTMRSSQWYHVSTANNPADCASRGILPSSLAGNTLWFSGPEFLKVKTIVYTRPKNLQIKLEEQIKSHAAAINDVAIFDRFSSLQKLVKVIAYCRRFLKKGKNNKRYLQKTEMEQALECCIRQTQLEIFPEEYSQLQKRGYVQIKSSKLKSLCPYLDIKGLIRVRGRLEKSQLEEPTKHPIILSSSSHLTKLIVADAHVKTLHGGPQLMMVYLRTAYWILGARNMVKNHVRKCVVCVRNKATTKNQLMGSLPAVRCSPARPFLHSGVDYAGPINVRTTKGRGHRSYKGYICLFVCMSTRALHLELVSDMSTEAFLAAFRRFVSRRGHCAKIWSDNGSTFVGASRELHQLKSIQISVAQHLEENGTEWHFIPPHGPNFGGLWESAVKSTKFHLKRIIGETTLTYEEFTTLLNQVEACLNSRPMSVIQLDDPGKVQPLTPGHFLIGEPIVNVPEHDYLSSNVTYLTRWQHVQRMLQSFWRRWSQEYLTSLMNRYKWSSQVPEPEIGDVVLIKEDNLPPSRWLLGRVLEKHPGDDNITRVVTVRTTSSVVKRPTSKICILPIAD